MRAFCGLVVGAALLLLPGCGPVRMECNVCGETQSFNTCQDLYCQYLAAASLCAATDLNACYRDNGCPSPYFLFCPADTQDQ